MPQSDNPIPSVLFIFAHPDDETFGVAGVMTLLRRSDVPVTLISATRGEVGGISDPALATPETLGLVREKELRTAMDLVGVGDVRFLGYRDSGMEGTPENDDPRALAQAPEPTVAVEIAALIREIRPTTVVTFGPDGIYGHPDHLTVHRTATAAVHLAATPATDADMDAWRTPVLYYQTASRERLMERAASRSGPFSDMTPERLASLGTPRAEIIMTIDVTSVVEVKEAAMRAHRTQIGPAGPMSELPRDQVLQMLSREHFVRVPLPWAAPRDAVDQLGALAPDFATTPA